MSASHPATPDAPPWDMSITVGENTAREMGITRRDADEWAARSHRNAAASIDNGWFAAEACCGDCATAYCEECLVRPFGPSKPPLCIGCALRMAGVRVGRVSSLKLENGKARVDFTVDSSQSIYAATKAAIRYQNLIGQRYIQLTLVDGQPRTPLGPGSRLRQPSEDSFDVTRLLAGFQPLFDTLTSEQINGLSQGLIAVFQGDQVSLTNTVAQISTLANDMANRDQVIGSIVTHLSGVMRDLARQGTQMSDLVKGTGDLIASLNSNSAAFGKVVTDVGRTAAGFGAILGQSQSSLARAGADAALATKKLIG